MFEVLNEARRMVRKVRGGATDYGEKKERRREW